MKINYNRKKREPEVDRQIKVNYAPAKRVLNKFKWRLTVLVILSPFIYFVGKLLFGLLLSSASGFVVLNNSMTYQAPRDCAVEEIHVSTGENVKSGQLLVILKDSELEELIKKATKDLDNLKNILITNEDIKVNYLRKQLGQAQKSLVYYTQQYSKINYLFERQAATVNEKKTALLQLDAIRSKYYDIEYEIESLKLEKIQTNQELSVRPEYIALVDKIKELRQKKSQLVIRAKGDEAITSLDVQTGNVLFRGDQILRSVVKDKPVIIAYVKPDFIDRIAQGQIADIKLPSGIKIKAIVQDNVLTTSRLPEYLTTPMLGRQRMLLVNLRPLQDVPEKELVDGLPVKVTFIGKTQTLITKIEKLFQWD